ncbi:hypothetical protein Micbo1qcDRAFT_181058 [Microdochium bolleyi]|uniref:Uncharacterized protein n=1 Tax=Microdochium bolleyi TaxID=196109 RepID=A0A136IJK6_9PEZI|nr:hypothetical protein Micbo1qcDRAFT_181058 [Microdochium bolleyi]
MASYREHTHRPKWQDEFYATLTKVVKEEFAKCLTWIIKHGEPRLKNIAATAAVEATSAWLEDPSLRGCIQGEVQEIYTKIEGALQSMHNIAEDMMRRDRYDADQREIMAAMNNIVEKMSTHFEVTSCHHDPLSQSYASVETAIQSVQKIAEQLFQRERCAVDPQEITAIITSGLEATFSASEARHADILRFTENMSHHFEISIAQSNNKVEAALQSIYNVAQDVIQRDRHDADQQEIISAMNDKLVANTILNEARQAETLTSITKNITLLQKTIEVYGAQAESIRTEPVQKAVTITGAVESVRLRMDDTDKPQTRKRKRLADDSPIPLKKTRIQPRRSKAGDGREDGDDATVDCYECKQSARNNIKVVQCNTWY